MITQTQQHAFDRAVQTIKSETVFTHAVQALEKLASNGHFSSAQFLADLYSQGFRVEKDSAKAQHWYKISKMHA